jgi:hypothetical protein
MAESNVDLQQVRERLRAGKLTSEDAKLLEEILVREDDLRKGVSSTGRPIIAHLPYGMDIVK